MPIRELIFVAIGGAAGAVARHTVNLAVSTWIGKGFAWGTLCVNVLGCLLLGWLLETLADGPNSTLKLTLGTGFLGALTTFSTFGVETIEHYQRSPLLGMANLIANLFLGLAAALLGMYLAMKVRG